MKKLFIFLFANVMAINFAFSQVGAAINTTGTTADPSAMLDVSSPNQGMLMPRLTTAERNLINIPATALLIFNTDCNEFQYYNGATWISIMNSSSLMPPVANAGSGATTTTITANWSASSEATSYYLDVSTINTFASFVTGYSNLDVGNVTNYNVTGLTSYTTYYYRVKAYNTCGTSSSSGIITYSTLWVCGNTLTDIRDNKIYSTVLIGTQCWMEQNLNFGKYVPIATGQGGVGTQKYCYGDNTANCTTYGGLYEWAQMMTDTITGTRQNSCNGIGASQVRCSTPVQGICPIGWHIPSHYEWTRLERVVGGSDSTAFLYDVSTTGWLGTTGEGGSLKEAGTSHWTSPNNCTPSGSCNSSGFTALPGGYSESGSFYVVGIYGQWWASTEVDATFAWLRCLKYSNAPVGRGTDGNKAADGWSVRCIKD